MEKETIGMEDIKKEKEKDFNGFKAILAWKYRQLY
jgi:hypothetical protein